MESLVAGALPVSRSDGSLKISMPLITGEAAQSGLQPVEPNLKYSEQYDTTSENPQNTPPRPHSSLLTSMSSHPS